MSSGGDEQLRAVLDKSCTLSVPMFYTLEAVYGATVTAQRVQLQCKADRWFLVNAISPYVINEDGEYSADDAIAMSLYDPSSTRRWSSVKNLMSQWGGNLAHQFTMPQYWLLDPAALIVLEIDAANVPVNSKVGVTLIGIEYGR